VKSIGRNGISLSAEPGFYQSHVQIIPRDHLALVLTGPARADNIWWWRLRTETGAEGWGSQDEMTPDPGPCAAGGNASPGSATPPYPVTIMPAFSFVPTSPAGELPVQVVPLEQPALQATPSPQEALPQTGSSIELWFLAGLLAVTMIVVGFVRRRLRAQPAAPEATPDETTQTKD
jgi:LPXTG-motif cell wall-anchored protein